MHHSKINTRTVGLGIVAVLAIASIATVWGSYNSLITNDQNVERTWADVEAQYQRRFDLIPNLVNIAESFAGFERSTLVEVTNLRSQWQAGGTINQQVQTAQEFEGALSRLIATFENYPQLRTSDQFLALQDSLAETENMVAVARTRYNAAVSSYNIVVRSFPSNIVASWFGFEQRAFFESTNGADQAPQVDINIPQ